MTRIHNGLCIIITIAIYVLILLTHVCKCTYMTAAANISEHVTRLSTDYYSQWSDDDAVGKMFATRIIAVIARFD